MAITPRDWTVIVCGQVAVLVNIAEMLDFHIRQMRYMTHLMPEAVAYAMQDGPVRAST